MKLFPDDGVPKGWLVTEWGDVGKKAPAGVTWEVKEGVLTAGKQRGTWLISEKEYGDFVLEFEIKLTERGNSGVAIRTPVKGDPAFDGLEFQVGEFRYNTKANDSELTDSLYRVVAPTKQVYKPTEWNSVRIEIKGDKFKAAVNGEVIQTASARPSECLTTSTCNGGNAPRVRTQADKRRSGRSTARNRLRNSGSVAVTTKRLSGLSIYSRSTFERPAIWR